MPKLSRGTPRSPTFSLGESAADFRYRTRLDNGPVTMAKKKSVSSRQERRVPASALFTTPISDKQRRELKRLATRPDSQIDFSDAPERQPRGSETNERDR